MTNLVLQQFTDIDTPVYCRSQSTESITLCQKLTTCYQTTHAINALPAASGMSAISITMHSIVEKHKADPMCLVSASELYCDTPKLLRSFNIPSHVFDVKDTSSLVSIFDAQKDKVVILFIESASNPSSDLFDFSVIPTLRKKCRRLYVVVDNTWLTHVIFNPFDFGADVVILSLTKYYSAGTCIAGAILFKKKLYSRMWSHIKMNGLHVSPIHCGIVAEKIDSMTDRMTAASAVTVKVAALLATKTEVRHLSLEQHPTRHLVSKLFSGDIYPSVLSFVLPMGIADAKTWMQTKKIAYETSYGSSYTRLDPWPKILDDSHTLCRLAVGYAADADVILEQLGDF